MGGGERGGWNLMGGFNGVLIGKMEEFGKRKNIIGGLWGV